MTKIDAGSEGSPLPEGTLVFRIGKGLRLNTEAIETNQGLEILFELSSTDKESPGQRLSIWVEELTLPDQAWDIMGRNPASTVVACINVDSICGIAPPDPFAPLRVEWERAIRSDGTPNTKPGADGHCGISGLNQGGKGKVDGNRRKELRSKLADLARISPVPVPHDIPEEVLHVAAYYISIDPHTPDGDCEDNWIRAIRMIRRLRVRESVK
jgi:hypothetical protein